MYNSICSKHVIILALTCITLITGNIVEAKKLLGSYNPNKNASQPVNQKASLGSGSRSDNCKSRAPINSISLLVPPEEVVHTTSNAQPSFFVLSKNLSKIKAKFTLIEPRKSEPLFEHSLELNNGIKQIDLPNHVSLTENKIFIWHLAISCQNAPHEYYDVLSAAIQRVPISTDLKSTLNQKQTHQIAAVYADHGIWYDSLKYAFQSSDNILQNLLSSVGISLDYDFQSQEDPKIDF